VNIGDGELENSEKKIDLWLTSVVAAAAVVE